MKTPIQELIKYINDEVSLGFISPGTGERIKWYIETYWTKKEKEFAHKCFLAGSDYGIDVASLWEYEKLTVANFEDFYEQFEE